MGLHLPSFRSHSIVSDPPTQSIIFTTICLNLLLWNPLGSQSGCVIILRSKLEEKCDKDWVLQNLSSTQMF